MEVTAATGHPEQADVICQHGIAKPGSMSHELGDKELDGQQPENGAKANLVGRGELRSVGLLLAGEVKLRDAGGASAHFVAQTYGRRRGYICHLERSSELGWLAPQ